MNSTTRLGESIMPFKKARSGKMPRPIKKGKREKSWLLSKKNSF